MDFGANGSKAAVFSEDFGNRLQKRCFLRLLVMGDLTESRESPRLQIQRLRQLERNRDKTRAHILT